MDLAPITATALLGGSILGLFYFIGYMIFRKSKQESGTHTGYE